jgi:DNA-binding MarR family transcriptional regulator
VRLRRSGEKMMDDGARFSKAQYVALARFRLTIRRFLRFSELAVRKAGLTPQQYQLLLAIKGTPDRDWATITELSEQLQLRHNTVSSLVDRTAKLALIAKVEHETDKRAVAISLTPDGERKLETLVALHQTELKRIQDLLRVPTFGTAGDGGTDDGGPKGL